MRLQHHKSFIVNDGKSNDLIPTKRNLAELGEVEEIAQKGRTHNEDRFKIMPDDEYPDTYMNREELRREMNKQSAIFHNCNMRGVGTTACDGHDQIGELRLEILQCFGLPPSRLLREVAPYCVAVCGPYAFRTDTMPPVGNPMWLSRMRRACVLPLHHGFARLYIGCLDRSTDNTDLSDFIGRIVLDICKLRPSCTYDVTVPFRQSTHIFDSRPRGSIRIRIHLTWKSERDLVLSYLPKSKPTFKPYDKITINCVDDRSFRDVALVVHGKHMPGRFSMELLHGTIREMNYTNVHVTRYLQKREIYNLRNYIYPTISTFVFGAWMHCVYKQSVQYIPGHLITYVLLHLWKNYAYYAVDSSIFNGFVPPTVEELFRALLYGTKERTKKRKQHCITPLDMIVDERHSVVLHNSSKDSDNNTTTITKEDGINISAKSMPIYAIAETMRKSVPVHTHVHKFQKYTKCFLGSEAVDFMLTFGFASTNEEAVELGKKLQKETKLFHHIGEHYKEFNNGPDVFYFLRYDTHKYIIQGHKPRGKTIFQLLGFWENYNKNDDDDILNRQVPFPFATFKDHPRSTVKNSIFRRSKKRESADDIKAPSNKNSKTKKVKQLLSSSSGNKKEEAATVETEQDSSDMSGFLDEPKIQDSFDENDYDSDGDVNEVSVREEKCGTMMEVKVLKPPNTQDMSVKVKGNDKPLQKTMEERRHKAHNIFLHFFNVKTFRIDPALFPSSEQLEQQQQQQQHNNSISSSRSGGSEEFKDSIIRSGSSSKKTFLRKLGKNSAKSKKNKDVVDKSFSHKIKSARDHRQSEYQRLLNMNQSNPMMSRVATVLQPMIEMSQVFLFFFRAMFNLFTWQDPILSFWVAVLGPVFVIGFHFAPWRILFGVGGIVFIGPQNWILRLWKQRMGTYVPPDFDKKIQKKEVHKDMNLEEMLFFSEDAPGCSDIPNDPMDVKQVVVPYTTLNFYTRFNDWPPEAEYATVRADDNNDDDDDDNDNMQSEDSSSELLPRESNHSYMSSQRKKKQPLLHKISRKITPTAGLKKKTMRITLGEFNGRVGGAVSTAVLGRTSSPQQQKRLQWRGGKTKNKNNNNNNHDSDENLC